MNTVTVTIKTDATDPGEVIERIATFVGNEAAEFVLANEDDRNATVSARVNDREVAFWNNEGIEWESPG